MWLQNNEGSDKFSGLNRYSGRLILQINGERKEVSFKNGGLIGWYLNFQGWQYVPSLSEKDHMCCNLRVRFSINQNNASACSVCSGSRFAVWPHPDKRRKRWICYGYNGTSISRSENFLWYILAATAWTDMKLQLQIDLAGIIPQNDNCGDGKKHPHRLLVGRMQTAFQASAGHFEAVWQTGLDVGLWTQRGGKCMQVFFFFCCLPVWAS